MSFRDEVSRVYRYDEAMGERCRALLSRQWDPLYLPNCRIDDIFLEYCGMYDTWNKLIWKLRGTKGKPAKREIIKQLNKIYHEEPQYARRAYMKLFSLTDRPHDDTDWLFRDFLRDIEYLFYHVPEYYTADADDPSFLDSVKSRTAQFFDDNGLDLTDGLLGRLENMLNSKMYSNVCPEKYCRLCVQVIDKCKRGEISYA